MGQLGAGVERVRVEVQHHRHQALGGKATKKKMRGFLRLFLRLLPAAKQAGHSRTQRVVVVLLLETKTVIKFASNLLKH